MESFQDLISTIPDAKTLLVPNESLSSSALKALEELADDFNEYIMTSGFDEEQIWAQISLLTPKVIEKLQNMKEVEKAQADSDIEIDENEEIEDNQDDNEDEDEEDSEAMLDEDSEENSEVKDISKDRKHQKPQDHKDEDQNSQGSNPDQDFFDFDEMKRFADEGENEHADPALSVSESSDSQEQEVKYSEFYQDEEASEEEPEKLFNYIEEKEFNRLEDKLVSEKPWQLKGEITSNSRPKDSLLNEQLEFDVARKPVPQTQTKAVTDEIEDIIKQRVLDLLFDDVKPKRAFDPIKTKTTAEDFMDYEKSKKSLAELYEDDFKKDVLHIPVNTETERAKKEITIVFKKLCYNLDLISSLHPVPRPVVQTLSIKSASVPALVLEEVLPHAVSMKDTLNPAEVFDPRQASLKAEDEYTKSERNTIRKRHKSTLRTRKKERILKIMNKIAQDPKAQKFEYRKMLREEKAKKELIERKKQSRTKFTRSSEFFKNFDELKKEIKEKDKGKGKKVERLDVLSKKVKL